MDMSIRHPVLPAASWPYKNITPALASKLSETAFPGKELLSRRERVVLLHLIDGAGSKEVARRLSRSQRTVDKHRLHIHQKLGTHCMAELIFKCLLPLIPV